MRATWIALVRHGVSRWNERNLIQGRTDIALSDAGIARLKQTQPCAQWLAARWLCSPLQRAQATAALLNPAGDIEITEALIETNWGEFEGLRRDRLAARIAELNLTPDHGLDFQPPGGESARMVQARLAAWLRGLPIGARMVAVTHKGVIRNALSLACDWQMSDEFRPKPNWALPHLFCVVEGELRLVQLNCAWGEVPPWAGE